MKSKKHRFKIGKMVRDKMPDVLRALDIHPTTYVLGPDAYLEHLNKKLLEEAVEVVSAASAKEKAEELGDVLEVLYALAASLGMTMEDIERIRQEKTGKRGGFTKGIFCEYDELREDNLYYNFYLSRRDQYPELEIPTEEQESLK